MAVVAGGPGRPGARPRLLILRALGIGDLLAAAPALRALARSFPGHERVLATSPGLKPLVDLIDQAGQPAVDRLVAVGELEPLPDHLHGVAVAANLHGSGPQSHRLLLAGRPARVLWFQHPEVPESRGAPRWRRGEHEASRWCRMLAEHGVPADPAELWLRPPDGPLPPGVTGATLVHPGAASPARRWPPERFAEVARAQAARGRPVVITGSPEERPIAERVARLAGLPPSSVLAGATDLGGLARAVAGAGRVVCGDTGVGHMATAFGTPSVLLFGPTPPAEWGPPPGSDRHRPLWAGRTGDPHGPRVDQGLLAITPRQVLEALDGLPATASSEAA